MQMYSWIRSLPFHQFNKSKNIFVSTLRRSFFPYLIGKRYLVWFTPKKACNDAKQLDEQNITIYCANYLIETGSLTDRQHSDWPLKMLTCKSLYCMTSSRRNRYQKRPKSGLLFAWCIWNEILFWNGEKSSCLNVSQRRLSTDINF